TQPAHGTVVINPDGTVSYTPDANYNGADSFTYTISDGNGGTATATVNLTVTPVNDPPVANDDTFTVAEDSGSTALDVLGNDSILPDAGETLTVTAVTQPAHGTVVINPDGTISYTPDANYNGADSFTYTISDGNGGTATATVNLTVTPVNDPPVANDDTFTVAEDSGSTALDVLGNDSILPDAGETLTVTSVTQPAHGTVAINPDGTVSYTPDADYNGADSFTYTISDGNGGTATATVNLTVTPVNDPPVANDDTFTVAEDSGATALDVLGNDSILPDAGETLTVTAVTQPAHGTVVINPDGTVSYTPDADYNGADSFTYTISDGNGGTATATVNLTVTPVNDPPVANDDTFTVAEDSGSTALDVLGNDSILPDAGETLTVTAVTQPAHGTVVINPDGTVSYTPDANYNGADSFTYTISDGNGGTATATVNLTVTPVNDPPVANDDTFTVAEDSGATALDVLGNDSILPDAGETLTVTSVTQPAHGTVAINPDGTVSYTPDANYNGADSFTYTISDGNGGTATATVSLTVTPVNDPPVANDDTFTVAEDSGSTALDVLGNDSILPDAGETLTVTAVTQPAHGTVVINPDGTVSYTPDADYNGADSFTYTISDGNGGTATATVNLTVTPVNDPPVANDDTFTVAEDSGATALDVLGNDSILPDAGETLTVTAVTQPAHGTVAINPDGTVSYTPDANYNGADSFTYTISDGNGGTATATVNLTVTPVNDPPVANDDTFTVAEDSGSTALDVLGNDSILPDAGETLTVTAVTQPAHGTVVINPDGTVSYTPDANYNGADSFTYTISDGNGGTATATVNLTVTPVNDPPVANDDTFTVAEDSGATALDVLGNDSILPDAGETLTVTSVTQPAHGTVAINPDGTVSYTPDANYNGADSFTYTISDGNGGTATATVSLTVTPVNDPPVANDDTFTVAEDSGSTALDVLGNDSILPDAGETLTVTAVTQPAHGTVVINPDGTVSYTPDADYNGADSFTYTISDGNGGTATATVNLTVTPVNDPPVANDDTFTVAEDSGATALDVLGNDSILPDTGETLTVTSVTQPAHGTVVINPDGTVSYTPDANYNGADSFTYTISDGNGGTATATVNLTVTPVNDPPVANDDTFTVAEDSGATALDVLGNDSILPDTGETLAVTAVTQPAHGTVVINPDGTVSYTPDANYNGADSFTYTISDGNGGTATATVNLTVTPVNDPPVANDDTFTVAEDSGATALNVLGNDSILPDTGETLTVTSVTQPAHGTVAINPDGTISYTPDANYNGADSFTYTISDGNGGTATATVNL
ncbi:MAG: beta strand repeat-containing protein, partial [Pyrinomonadaceae bacterium]